MDELTKRYILYIESVFGRSWREGYPELYEVPEDEFAMAVADIYYSLLESGELVD